MKTNRFLLVFVLVSVGWSSSKGNVSNDFVNSSDSGDQTRFRRNADSLSDKLSDQDLQFIFPGTPDMFSSFFSNQTRFKRNADPLSDYSGKLSTVARISNGISLLAGLINKNIPIDTVIEELLHFGNVKLADVVAFPMDKVEAVVSQLEATNKSLVTNPVVDLLEKNTIGMGRVREAFIESDFGNFKHPADYFKDAQSFKDDQTDYSVFKTAVNTSKSAIDALAKLESLPELTTITSSYTAGDIKSVVANLNDLEKVKNNLETLSKQIDSLGNLVNGAETLKPVQQMLDLLAVHRSVPNVQKNHVAEAGKNFDAISPLSSAFAQSNLAVLSDLVSSRLKQSSTKRQYTPGFPNGASDLKKLVKDIRDPSFETTIGGGKNFARLSSGLKPLEGFSAKVEVSEAQLKPLATVETLKSVGNALKLQNLMTGLTVSSADAVDVTNMLINNQFFAIPVVGVTEVVNLIGNAVQVSGKLARIKSLASVFPQHPQEVTDVNDILKKLPDMHGLQEVQDVINDLKTVPEKVKKVKEYLGQLQEFLNDVPDPTATRQTAELIVNAEGELIRIKGEIDQNVVPKLTAIRDMKEPIDSVVKALKATKVIKDFKPEDISKIRSAVDTLAKAASSIKDLQKKPTSRKKRQTDEVKELIGFRDAQKTSEALGSAAVSINSMSQLKGMETTVVQGVRTKSTIFNTEIAKVTDGSKKSEILKKWGDQKAFISSLDTTVNQIKDFGAKLSVDKDLRKLGAQLDASKTVSDVTQSISDKSEAVGLLILETSDANVKAELEALKTQLDSLAALDLQFSAHHSAFPNVSGALKSFFDFVSGFVTPKKQPSGSSGAGGAGGSNGGSAGGLDWYWYLTMVGGAILLIGTITIVVCLIKKFIASLPCSFKKLKDTFIKKCLAQNWQEGTAIAKGVYMELKHEEKGHFSGPFKFPKERIRYGSTVRFSTQVYGKFKAPLGLRPYIDANYVSVPGSAKFIATQGPMTAGGGKVDTIADFLYMVLDHKCEYVVQLCHWEELPEYCLHLWDDEKIVVNKCARYYPKLHETAEYGDCTVETLEKERILGGYVMRRKLKITKKNGMSAVITHLHHLKWPDHGVPDSEEQTIELMKLVCKSKRPIVVHCSAGRGRTITFISINCIMKIAERQPSIPLREAFMRIRLQRLGGIQSHEQSFFALNCGLMIYAEEHKKTKELFTEAVKTAYKTAMKKLREEAYASTEAELIYNNYERRLKYAADTGRDTPKEILNIDRILPLKSIAEIVAMNVEARLPEVVAARKKKVEDDKKTKEEEKTDKALRDKNWAAKCVGWKEAFSKANNWKEPKELKDWEDSEKPKDSKKSKDSKEPVESKEEPKEEKQEEPVAAVDIGEPMDPISNVSDQVKLELDNMLAEAAEKAAKKAAEEAAAKKEGGKKKSDEKTTASTEKTGGKSAETASKSREPGGKDCVAIDIDP